MPEPASPAAVPALPADRYVVQRELGRGGMATVYLAEERRYGRQVAVKVLHPELATAFGAERFLREIAIAARLAHPHLVPLLDSGEAGGLLYYVSAYVPGGSLRDRLAREGPLPVADALRIADEVGAALDYAHRAGFVHRDVKPENILFADGHALLADFGLARATCDEREPVTAVGLALGTPEYMSPEQAAGERDLGVPSDVYALACVVFEMLAGEPPLRGPTARATMAKQVAEAPPRVRARRAEVPPGADDAVARALAKEPAHRFARVADFTAALRAGPAGRARSAAARAARAIAVLPFVNASPDPDNEYLSDGITDELIVALARVEGLRVVSRASAFALKGKPQDARAIGALLDCGVVLDGTVRRAGARVRVTAQLTSTDDGRLLWSERYDRTLDDVLAIQDEIARTIVDTLRATTFADLAPPPRRHTTNVRAYRLYLKGRYEWNRRTHSALAAAVRHFEQAIAEDPGYAPAYTGLADCYALEMDYRSIPVREGFERAKAYARRALAIDDTLAEAHASLAWALFIHDWDWAGAEREFRRAVAADPRYASAHQWYAFLHASRGALADALVEAHTAADLDPGSVSVRRALGGTYYYARRWDQARLHLERALAMDPDAEETYRTLGLVLATAGDADEAERVLREAAAMPGAGTYTEATLGFALARAGRRDEAAAILARLEERARRDYVSPVALATVHLGLGDVERALDAAERALADRRGWMVYLRVNPMLDPLRGHPRFEALAARVGV